MHQNRWSHRPPSCIIWSRETPIRFLCSRAFVKAFLSNGFILQSFIGPLTAVVVPDNQAADAGKHPLHVAENVREGVILPAGFLPQPISIGIVSSSDMSEGCPLIWKGRGGWLGCGHGERILRMDAL